MPGNGGSPVIGAASPRSSRAADCDRPWAAALGPRATVRPAAAIWPLRRRTLVTASDTLGICQGTTAPFRGCKPSPDGGGEIASCHHEHRGSPPPPASVFASPSGTVAILDAPQAVLPRRTSQPVPDRVRRAWMAANRARNSSAARTGGHGSMSRSSGSTFSRSGQCHASLASSRRWSRAAPGRWP